MLKACCDEIPDLCFEIGTLIASPPPRRNAARLQLYASRHVPRATRTREEDLFFGKCFLPVQWRKDSANMVSHGQDAIEAQL
jgi:hypothetical protein